MTWRKLKSSIRSNPAMIDPYRVLTPAQADALIQKEGLPSLGRIMESARNRCVKADIPWPESIQTQRVHSRDNKHRSRLHRWSIACAASLLLVVFLGFTQTGNTLAASLINIVSQVTNNIVFYWNNDVGNAFSDEWAAIPPTLQQGPIVPMLEDSSNDSIGHPDAVPKQENFNQILAQVVQQTGDAPVILSSDGFVMQQVNTFPENLAGYVLEVLYADPTGKKVRITQTWLEDDNTGFTVSTDHAQFYQREILGEVTADCILSSDGVLSIGAKVKGSYLVIGIEKGIASNQVIDGLTYY